MFIVVNDKTVLNRHIFYAFKTYLFLYFLNISRLYDSFVSFFKLFQVYEKCSNVLIEKTLHVSRPKQFKPVMFKESTGIER